MERTIRMGSDLLKRQDDTEIQLRSRMARSIRGLKNGKISLKLTNKIRGILTDLVRLRIGTTEDDLREVILTDLHRILTESDGRIQLTKSEFICLFEDEAFQDVPETIKTLVFASLNLESKPNR